MLKFIRLECTSFARFESILRSPKVILNCKIRLFKAACISILMYGCESLTDKLDIFARLCYRIVLNSLETTWQTRIYIILLAKRLSARSSASASLSSKVTVLAYRQTSPPTDLPSMNSRSGPRQGTPRTTYLNQILPHILPGEKALEVNELRKMAMSKSKWS